MDQRQVRSRRRGGVKFFQGFVGRTFRQPCLANVQVKLRRILPNRQHLVESLLLQNRIRGLAGRDAKDIEIVQVARFSIPNWRESIDRFFVFVREKVAKSQKIPCLQRIRRSVEGFGKGRNS